MFVIYGILRSIDKGNNRETRIGHIYELKNWSSLKAYLELLLELHWIESFEREESTPFNWLNPGPLRHWKTRWFKLSPLGKEFVELFPTALVPVVEEELLNPEERARNYEEWLRSGPKSDEI